MGILFLTKNYLQWPLQKNRLSKVSSTKFGRLMMSTNQVLLTKKRPRNSFKIPLETSDPVMNSPTRLSMRSSPPSTRITPVPLRRTRWSSSPSNSSEDNEQDEERHRFRILD